ncbi:ArnT family glycosyltransferase [Aquimarina sp. SS2-1]|uniref:ArnT family glycosyltransferase n=1 Tax=Aquimarina besae TaxID=3342247 RepID=UPI00366EEBA7
MSNRKYIVFHILIILLLLIIIADNLFSEGMFMDGSIYASISKNLSNNIGSFWYPHFTETIAPQFHGHPPLALGLQSVFFNIFGDSIFIERFYGLGIHMLVLLCIIVIWKEIGNDKSTAWVPVLFWFSIYAVRWAVSNNILENTMMLFVCLSIIFYLKSQKKHRYFFIVLSGLALSAGVLSKGLTCLYCWFLPFWIGVFKKEFNLRDIVSDTTVLVSCTVLPILLLYLISGEAADSLTKYVEIQIINSLNNEVTVDSRFYIIKSFMVAIREPLIVFLSLLIFIRLFVSKIHFSRKQVQKSLPFLIVSFFGVFPVMISLKQSYIYIITVYPIFSIGLASLMEPLLLKMMEFINTKKNLFNLILIVNVCALFLAILQINKNFGAINSDVNIIRDVQKIIKVVPENSTISISPNMYNQWPLHGYFARYANISLDSDIQKSHSYFLTQDDSVLNDISKKYDELELSLGNYRLFILKPE